MQFNQGDMGGQYDSAATQETIDFRQDSGLTPDGVVGPQPYQKLVKAQDVATEDQHS